MIFFIFYFFNSFAFIKFVVSFFKIKNHSMKQLFTLIFISVAIILQGQPTHEFQKILASDGQEDDMFGNSLAIFGNIAVIGTPQDDDIANNAGAVYIYQRTGASWNFVQKLTVSDGEEADMFGTSVDISENYIVVGSYQAVGITANTGAAYVFVKDGTNWTLQSKIYANDGESADNFGKSVAISGDFIVVGADNEDFGSGSAYVFQRQDTVWTQVAKLEGSDELNDYFAHSVDIDSNYIAVGAWQSNAPESNTGSVFVFKNNGSTWELDTQLVANDAAIDDRLGYSVAIDGNYIVAGAFGCDMTKGAAYVFHNNGETWEQQAKLTASNGSAEDYFGKNVSMSGDYILVGAQRYDNAKGDEGTAYLFVRDGSTWQMQHQFLASDAEDTGLYGYCTAIDGDFALVSTVQLNGAVYALGPEGLKISAHNINNNIVIYPNPADNFIKILSDEDILSIEILTLNGKLIKKTDIAQTIDISGIAPGSYLLKITTKNRIFSGKFMKK